MTGPEAAALSKLVTKVDAIDAKVDGIGARLGRLETKDEAAERARMVAEQTAKAARDLKVEVAQAAMLARDERRATIRFAVAVASGVAVVGAAIFRLVVPQ